MKDVITIVAGGWSAKKIVEQTNLPGLVIAVNDSAYHLPRCDIICSMDRRWTENRWAWLCDKKLPTFIRSQALKRITDRPKWLTVFECDHESSDFAEGQSTDGVWWLNGTNSGACALNLAYVLAMKRSSLRVLLVGFDMQYGPRGERHWYPAGNWGIGKLVGDWYDQFGDAKKAFDAIGVEVLVVGDYSRITTFQRIQPDQINA